MGPVAWLLDLDECGTYTLTEKGNFVTIASRFPVIRAIGADSLDRNHLADTAVSGTDSMGSGPEEIAELVQVAAVDTFLVVRTPLLEIQP
jgi:hypothetical protein